MLDYIPVGDLGRNRDKFLEKVTRKVGRGNWFWAYRADKRLLSWEWGLQLYEDALWQFLRNDISRIKELVGAGNAYVYNRHDIDSGLDYKKQNCDEDHYQDIAIRRCLIRFGLWFHGKDLLSVQTSIFNDENIPFHLPHLIQKPDDVRSSKSWLYGNRLIVVAESIEDKGRLAELLVK